MIDSGIGGLYYLKKINDKNNQYILIMDKAYFPYGDKSIEFLLKRTLYLSYYLYNKVDKIILACNTISLIALPFLRLFFDNISGVFNEFIPYINNNSAIIGSNRTITYLKNKYPNNVLLDGSNLIYKLENNMIYSKDIQEINQMIKGCSNIILACTHFLRLNDKIFIIEEIKNTKITK